MPNMILKTTNLTSGDIYYPVELVEHELGLKTIVSYISGPKTNIDEHLLQSLFQDAEKTNPDDLDDVKKAYKR